MLDVGAVRAFESAAELTMDGYAGRTVWSDLFRAVAKGEHNPNGYTYVGEQWAAADAGRIAAAAEH